MAAPRPPGFDTLSLHAGQHPDPTHGARAVPIYQTTSYVFDDTDQAASLFNLERPGYVYSRISNPTVAVLEERLAALEGGVGAVCTASGMAAMHIGIATIVGAGDHIVASASLYGGTVNLLSHTLPRFGITTSFAKPRDIGGALIDGGRFDWEASGRYPTLTEPVAAYQGIVFTEQFGPAAFLMRARTEGLRQFGVCLSPMNAFHLLQGVETLSLRIERHMANTTAVLEFLKRNDAVAWVLHPSLPDHPDHELARRLLPRGAGSMISFGIKGGRAAGAKFIEALRLASHLANVGDAKTLVIHPATTTHQQMNPAQLAAAGIGEDMVRLSVGIESIDDIVADLGQALRAAQKI
jgi:O-acetylhomoserine/O-acetylserine sulfhydrylase-like pyridoxal-dependent enzyme